MLRKFWGLSVAATIMAGCTGNDASVSADILFHNGTVFTATDETRTYSAVAVKDGRIFRVGDETLSEEIRAVRLVDLQGRLLMPGFNDSHDHVDGAPRHHIDLNGVESIEKLKQLVREKAEELGEGQWITGNGWSEDEMTERRRPMLDDLDEAAPNNPVILERPGSHSAVANSLALELAGIDENTPAPEGAIDERDESGRLNGILRERFDAVRRLPAPGTLDELRESVEEQLRARLALGITSTTEAWTRPEVYTEQWLPVYEGVGDFLPRATVQIDFDARTVTAEEANAAMAAFGFRTGDGDTRLKVGALKVVFDGGFTGPAAWTIAPYDSDPDFRRGAGAFETIDLPTGLIQTCL